MTSTEPFVPMTGRSQPTYGDQPLVEMLGHIQKTHPGMNMAVEVFSHDQRSYSVNEAARVSAIAMKRLLKRIDDAAR
jgi:hypothetical protein